MYEVIGKLIITLILMVIFLLAILILPGLMKCGFEMLPEWLQTTVAVIIMLTLLGILGVMTYIEI